METSQGPFRGTFVSTGAAETIAVPCGVDYIRFINRTNWTANDPVGPVVVGGHWFADMANGSALLERKLTGDNTLEAVAISSNGFTPIDDADPETFAAVALANPAFTQAASAVWSTGTPHGFAVGDIVRVTNTTAALQYAGMDLTVTASGSTTTFTSNLNTTGITQATAGFARKIASDGFYFPRNRIITEVTRGTTTTIRMSVSHGYQVNQYVSFRVPEAYGMIELDGLRGKIIAIDDTITVNTITVDIDSSGFTAFAFPASADFQTTFAQVIPVGDYYTTLSGAETNLGIIGIQFGTGVVGAADDIIDFWCFKGNQIL